MADLITINLRHVARGLGIPLRQVEAVVELLDEGNTVPFITRYRKDQTGGLDEEAIRQIQFRLTKMRLLAERKQTILRSIEAQGKLTEQLADQIRAAGTTKRLEDLYLPFKPKKQTLATVARSRGLELLATEILNGTVGSPELDARAADFVNPDREVRTAADALLGAGHILAEQFSEQAELRQRLREVLQRTGGLVCSRIGPEQKAFSEKPEKPARPEVSLQHAAGASSAEATTTILHPAQTPQSSGNNPMSEAHGNPGGCACAEGSGTGADPADGSGPTTGNPPQVSGEILPATGPVAEESQPGNSSSDPSASSNAIAADPEHAEPMPAIEPPPGIQPAAGVQPAPPERKPAPRHTRAELNRDKREQKKRKEEERKQKAFSDYFSYSEEIRKIPPHRVLAINRGERARVLRVRMECDLEETYRVLDELCVPPGHPHAEFLRGCARDALTRLILPSLDREIRRELTERAETHAVTVFARNLRNLLLQPPVRDRRVLAIDPGYKSGCKLVALDQFGSVLGHDVIYLIGKPDRRQEARQIVASLMGRFELTVVAIGNGTACRDTEDFVAELLAGELKDKGIPYVIVNEAGASVYSTSRIGREEFPQSDASLRGAISIGRRLQDPLSELVKIEPANLGVGLYQHDIKAKHLQESLDEVVESCVNYVGVDVNTSSPALLRYVSGLNQLTARRLYEHRLEHGPFRARQQLKDVPGIGEATFVQAAGFLKIVGDNPLDATWIHPESYEIAGKVLARLDGTPADLAVKETAAARAERLGKIDAFALAKELEVGTMSLRDIIAQLARPGRDPREDLPPPIFKRGVLKLEDLTPAMELTGTVLNVVDFGAFVDIGMHDSGLVHVSQLADRFVRDPYEVVAVGDIVRVWVLEVDKQRRRVSLTMIPPGHTRGGPRRHGKPEDRTRAEDRPRSEGPPRAEGPARAEGPGQAERPQAGGPPRRFGPPGGERRPPPKGPPQRASHGPPKFPPRPRPRPRPITPITDDMKTGKEPMRSFGDLMQFFEITHHDAGTKDQGRKPKPKGPKEKEKEPRPKPKEPADPRKTEPPQPQAQPEEPKAEPQTPQAEIERPPVEPEQLAAAPEAPVAQPGTPMAEIPPSLRDGQAAATEPDTPKAETPSPAAVAEEPSTQSEPPSAADERPTPHDGLPEAPGKGD